VSVTEEFVWPKGKIPGKAKYPIEKINDIDIGIDDC